MRLSDDERIAAARLTDEVRTRDARAVSLDGLITQYLADLAARTKPKHVRTTGDQLRRVAAGIKQLSCQELIAYRSRRLITRISYRDKGSKQAREIAKTPSNHTVNAEIKALSTMLEWARRAEIVLDNPAARIDPLPEREVDLRKKRRALSDKDIAKILAECRLMDLNRKVPQAPMWELMLTTALRWGQVVALKPEDLKGCTLLVRCEHEKVGTSRELPLPRDLARAISLPFRTPTGKPYEPNRGFALAQLKNLAKKAGVPLVDARGQSIDIHGLRKTAASRYARRGVKAPALQRLLGHADPRTTLKHYVELSLDDLRRLMKQHWRFDSSEGVTQR